MLVAVDASVLIHLSRIGRFHLIKSLYQNAVISPSVYREVVEKGWGLPGSLETEKAVHEGWVKIVDVVNKWKVREIAAQQRIHMANAETIQLAQEVKPDFVLADEEEIRRLVEENNIRIRGCLGILIDGVRRKLISISEAKRGVQELRNSGYRISIEILKTFDALLKGLEENQGSGNKDHPETY